MTTNAQAALQAAATAFSGRMKAVIAEEVLSLAVHYKAWLDSTEPPEEVSHHISCVSRRNIECNCTPVPYRDRLIEWDLPVRQTADLAPHPHPGDGRYPKHLWKMDLRPRNTKEENFELTVVAGDEGEAISRAISAYPGHSWSNVRDTGEVWDDK